MVILIIMSFTLNSGMEISNSIIIQKNIVNRVGGGASLRPPTPPYVLIVYGGFF